MNDPMPARNCMTRPENFIEKKQTGEKLFSKNLIFFMLLLTRAIYRCSGWCELIQICWAFSKYLWKCFLVFTHTMKYTSNIVLRRSQSWVDQGRAFFIIFIYYSYDESAFKYSTAGQLNSQRYPLRFNWVIIDNIGPTIKNSSYYLY